MHSRYKEKGCSPFGMVEFHRRATLHHVLEGSLLGCVVSSTSAEVSHCTISVLRVSLPSNRGTSVVCLILVYSLQIVCWSSCLRQSPSGEVLLTAWIRTCFRYIATWTHWARSGSLVLQGLSTTSTITESIVRCFHELRLVLWQVLWSWCCLQSVHLHLYSMNPFDELTLGSVPIFGALVLVFLERSAANGSSRKAAFS